eukprot:m.280702 g.280702  ORF g.280702 m.280702 type:complete len:377 (+) comp15750_c0_seq19:102-1232(+)
MVRATFLILLCAGFPTLKGLKQSIQAPQQDAILVTGGAGFIGFHVASSYLSQGHTVVVLDNMNDYYSLELKEARVRNLTARGVHFVRADLCEDQRLQALFQQFRFSKVAHFAAQAGVRYSLDRPHSYVHSNVDCFVTLLETLRVHPKTKLVYASSSSVYGKGASVPFTEDECSDQPTNVYGASKRMNELLAHAYHHLFHLDVIGLRFFTVFGPWGRPDMAPYRFTDAIAHGTGLTLFSGPNGTAMSRDFTSVHDVVDGVQLAFAKASGYQVFNIGQGNPIPTKSFIKYIQDELGVLANVEEQPAHSAELVHTFANISKAQSQLGFQPKVSTKAAVQEFVAWYKWFQMISSPISATPRDHVSPISSPDTVGTNDSSW